MNNIKKKISDGNKFVILIEDYSDKLYPLFMESYVDEQKNISKLILELKKNTKISELIDETDVVINKKGSFNNLLDSIFNTYEEISDYFLSLQSIIDLLNIAHLQPENIMSSEMSQTYKLETSDILKKITMQYMNYNKKYENAEEELISLYVSNLIESIEKEYLSSTKIDINKIKDIITDIQSKFHKNKNTIKLYSTFIQTFIDLLYEIGKHEHKQIMFYIMEIIELDKNFFLSGNIDNSLKPVINKSIHLINPALKRFGLLPVTDSLPLDKLIDIIDPQKKNKNVNLHKYAKENSVGFIVIKRVVYTPIEYNLRPLISLDIAKPLIQPSEFGITNKTITRFQTIKTLREEEEKKTGGRKSKSIHKRRKRSRANKKSDSSSDSCGCSYECHCDECTAAKGGKVRDGRINGRIKGHSDINSDNSLGRHTIGGNSSRSNSSSSETSEDTSTESSDSGSENFERKYSKEIYKAGGKKVSTKEKKTRNEWDFSYEIIDDANTNNYYVIETLDGLKYRALAPWLSDKNLSINKFRISQLLIYIKNSNTPNRIANYQALANKESAKHMFLTKPMSIDALAEQSKEVDTTIIKNEIYLKINRVIDDIITKEYSSGKKIVSDVDINNIIHDQRIRDTFIDTVLKLYKAGAKYSDIQEFDAGKFPFHELLSSFIVELEDITRRFMKDLHDGYNREPFKKEVYTLPVHDKMSAINKKIEEIINKTLQTIIGINENIYSALNYKYLLLNYH